MDDASAGVRDATDRRRRWVVGYFFALAALAYYPLASPGHVLILDAVGAPGFGHVQYLLASKDPLYYGRLPLAVLLDAAGAVVGDAAIQRATLVAILAGSGLAASRASPARSRHGRLFAGTLYAVNPFVYVRVLAGHWHLLLGYAVLPLAVVALADYLAGDRPLWIAVAWTTVACALDPHVAMLVALAGSIVAAVQCVSASRRRPVADRLGRFVLACAGVNAYWLVPAVRSALSGTTKLAAVGDLDLVAFGARGTLAGNVPLSVAALYGFWRDASPLAADVFSPPVAVALLGVVLYLAVSGWLSARTPRTTGIALVGLAGFALAVGVGSPVTAPLFRALYETVPGFGGMRDTQKFVALLAFAYAFLGGLGVDRLVDAAGRARIDRRPTGAAGLAAVTGVASLVSRVPVSTDDAARRRRRSVALLVVVLLVPLAAAAPMLPGFGGQLEPTTYPDDWHAANERLGEDPDAFRVLVVPWHQYLDLPWTRGTVVNPADAFFDDPVLRGRNVDLVGIESQAGDPAHAAVRDLLARSRAGEDPAVGARLAALGVKYVLVLDHPAAERDAALLAHESLTVGVETGGTTLYENGDFERAPPAADWPRSGPVVPWRALWLGFGVSVLAAAGLGVWTRGGPRFSRA